MDSAAQACFAGASVRGEIQCAHIAGKAAATGELADAASEIERSPARRFEGHAFS
jgi:hypothetical protein